MNYYEIKNRQPKLNNCFYAFSVEQFEEGLNKFNLTKKQVVKGPHGLFGTKEGINELFSFYDDLKNEIKNNCNPQKVYNYEFDNHECSYTCDDSEAIGMIQYYFGDDIAKTIKRKFGYVEI